MLDNNVTSLKYSTDLEIFHVSAVWQEDSGFA